MSSKESSRMDINEIADDIAHNYVREGLLDHLKALHECYLEPNNLFLTKDARNMNILHLAAMKGKFSINVNRFINF